MVYQFDFAPFCGDVALMIAWLPLAADNRLTNNKERPSMNRYAWQLPLLTIAIIICGAAFFRYPPHESAAVAAWVQAVGSVGAILIAVWVFHRQNEAALEQDASETRAFVQAIRTEMDVIWLGYSRGVRPHLDKLPQNDGLRIHAPLHAEALIIYSNSPGRVGKIDDEQLRDLAVSVYARMRGIIYTCTVGLVLSDGSSSTKPPSRSNHTSRLRAAFQLTRPWSS
jgi:hypothetical protein